MENVHYAFWVPLGGLEEMHAVHIRLIKKLILDLLLAITELFR